MASKSKSGAKKVYKSKVLTVGQTESGKPTVCGLSVCNFLRACGWYGFSAKQAHSCLTELGVNISPITCSCQVGGGRQVARGNMDPHHGGNLAEFTRDELEEIAALAGMEDVPVRPRPEGETSGKKKGKKKKGKKVTA